MSSHPLLEARGISKSFPGVQALSVVDFAVVPGEIHALVGENGAGKSTLVKILTGVYEPSAGTLVVDGQQVRITNRVDAERHGISVIHQEIALVPELDVASNMMLGKPPTFGEGWSQRIGVLDRSALYERAAQQLGRLNADVDPHTRAGSLGVSAAQLVLIARGLAQEMRVLILDEPTAALTPKEREELFARVRTLRERGVGILYVSHHLDEVLSLSDQITVMRDGRVVATMPTEEAKLERIVELMLARKLTEMFPLRRRTPNEPIVLDVRGLTRRGVLNDVNLRVRAGEIVGVTGLVGAGKSELARAIYGADPIDGGEIQVEGQHVVLRSPRDALDAGIALVPEDRKSQGLVLLMSIAQNIGLAVVNCAKVTAEATRFGQVLDQSRLSKLAVSFIDRFRIRARDESQATLDLSGGTQQKVVLAKCLATRPRIMILDEPTRGIDVGSKAEIYQVMEDLASEGVAILLMSSEIQEIIEMSDRIYVMRKGAIVAELPGSEASEPLVLRYAAAGA
jgi:ABC-type sugar transport system ATPase subunit